MKALGSEPQAWMFPKTEEGQSMRWSRFKNRDSREIYEIVGQKIFPFIKNMNAGNGEDVKTASP